MSIRTAPTFVRALPRSRALSALFPLALAASLVACDSPRESSGGGVTRPGNRDGGTTTLPTTPCGNGVINGLEACDGTNFPNGSECASLELGAGTLRCSSTCTLDTSQCAVHDYCTAHNLYGNGECDACELLGGVRDPDCDTVCAADGKCADRFDGLTNTWTCRRLGKTDPDCGMCGNGVIDGNELCDGRAFQEGKFTCESYGFLGGTLACKPDCSPNFAQCTYSVCGNGAIEGPEECDGTDFRGATCESRGFAGGNLTCNGCRIDDSACIVPGCNNGIVEANLAEDCDGTNLNNTTCQSLGFAGGNLGCSGTCHFETAACVASGCGNGIVEAPMEQCEGTNLMSASCQSLGFLQGNLTCSPTSCTYDTSACIAPGCGNNVIESPAEQCEGTNLNGQSCQSMGFAAGNLTCNSSCRYDTAGCLAAGCGNGVIERPAEQCEGNDLGGASCTSVGYAGGQLGCDGSCHFDTNGCFGTRDFCGDGRKNALEACDGTDFGTNSRNCADYQLGTGTVNCQQATCRLVFDGCTTNDPCEAGGWYGDGICDLCEYYSMQGHRDPDCGDVVTMGACGSNGVCAEYFDPLVGTFGCQLIQGQRDPDCGCGDNVLAPQQNGLSVELCDGTSFASGFPQMCTAYGFSTGTVTCGMDCAPAFDQCF